MNAYTEFIKGLNFEPEKSTDFVEVNFRFLYLLIGVNVFFTLIIALSLVIFLVKWSKKNSSKRKGKNANALVDPYKVEYDEMGVSTPNAFYSA